MFRQASLFGIAEPTVDDRFVSAVRVDLDDRCWIDHSVGWLTGADAVFDAVSDAVAFRQRRGVPMYDDLVDEPRLSAWWHAADGQREPVELLAHVRGLLAARYERPFDSIGFNLYRDGADSVAWHGDRHRHRVDDPVVAILSVGARRPLRLRPRGGGPSRAWALGDGDLFVMGGACQHDWEHCVPKLRTAVGPRLSITFRHDTR